MKGANLDAELESSLTTDTRDAAETLGKWGKKGPLTFGSEHALFKTLSQLFESPQPKTTTSRHALGIAALLLFHL